MPSDRAANTGWPNREAAARRKTRIAQAHSREKLVAQPEPCDRRANDHTRFRANETGAARSASECHAAEIKCATSDRARSNRGADQPDECRWSDGRTRARPSASSSSPASPKRHRNRGDSLDRHCPARSPAARLGSSGSRPHHTSNRPIHRRMSIWAVLEPKRVRGSMTWRNTNRRSQPTGALMRPKWPPAASGRASTVFRRHRCNSVEHRQRSPSGTSVPTS